jgi:probable HAF family extracellular repeat protein
MPDNMGCENGYNHVEQGELMRLAISSAVIIGLCGWISATWAADYAVTELPVALGQEYSSARDVNDTGRAVGHGYVSGGMVGAYQPVVWQGTLPTVLSLPAGFGGWATGINGRADVTGTVWSITNIYAGETSPVVWRGGQMTILDTLGMAGGSTSDINTAGTIVGQVRSTGGVDYRAALWSDTQAMQLGDFPGGQSGASAINSLNQVVIGVGYADRSETWIWHNGSLTQLPSLGGPAFSGGAINDLGEVVGAGSTADDPKTLRAFLFENGQTTALDGLPEDAVSYATSINNQGQIVGVADSGKGNRSVLWDGGERFDLNDLIPADSGWILSGASGISDTGIIVGWGMHDGAAVGYLLTPNADSPTHAPEPETLGLLMLGSTMLLRRRRKRRGAEARARRAREAGSGRWGNDSL